MANAAFINRRLLPGFEWMAENSYIPPGTHRLLAASGLAAGLWGGRHFMDVIVAKNSDGTDMTREQAPAMLRPIHGVLQYNRYSDNATDRWKGIVDRLTPGVTGGVGAYYGSRYFFQGTAPKFLGGKPLHGLSHASEKALTTGKVNSQTAEHLASLAQSEYMGRGGAVSYIFGSSVGTDKMGGLFPTNQNLWADRFAMGAGIKPKLPLVNWFNRAVLHTYGASSLAMPRAMRTTAKWMEGNLYTQGDPAKWADWANPQHRDMLRNFAKDALQNLPNNEPYIDTVAEGISTMAKHAWGGMQTLGNPSSWNANQKNAFYQDFIAGKGTGHGLVNESFDHWMHGMGVPLGKFVPGDNGILTKVARLFGSAKLEGEARKAYSSYLKDTFNVAFEGPIIPTLSQHDKLFLGGGLAAASVATIIGGAAIASRINKRTKQLSDGTEAVTDEPDDLVAKAKPPGQGNVIDWVNGTPLDMAQWTSRIMIIPPSMHRLMSAAYLSGGLYLGMQLANAMTGHKLTLLRGGSQAASEISRESFKGIWSPLRAVYGTLHYTPGSSLAADRWKQVAHYLIPIPLGVVGNSFGSQSYFKDRIKKFASPETMEDYSDRISMEQSGVFANLTAITSIFNTGSGLHLLPFINYSSNMQTRFMMGNGLQIATPGLGKWWSGNQGMTPWGPKRTLDYVSKYLGHNPDARPKEVAALVHSVLAKYYPDMPESELLPKKRAFLEAIYEVRDSYLEDGQVPPAKQPALAKAMASLVTGHGFEELLLVSGFDPLKADLKSNGASGHIANALGRGARVDRLEKEFKDKFAERIAKQQKPQDFLRSLANHSGEATPAANDNPALATPAHAPEHSVSPERERHGTVAASQVIRGQ